MADECQPRTRAHSCSNSKQNDSSSKVPRSYEVLYGPPTGVKCAGLRSIDSRDVHITPGLWSADSLTKSRHTRHTLFKSGTHTFLRCSREIVENPGRFVSVVDPPRRHQRHAVNIPVALVNVLTRWPDEPHGLCVGAWWLGGSRWALFLISWGTSPLTAVRSRSAWEMTSVTMQTGLLPHVCSWRDVGCGWRVWPRRISTLY